MGLMIMRRGFAVRAVTFVEENAIQRGLLGVVVGLDEGVAIA